MKSNQNSLFDRLDSYFKKLDGIQLEKNDLFSTFEDKERYETHFMYAIRKYNAAVYHFNQVMKYLEKDKARVETMEIKAKDSEKFNVDIPTNSIKMTYSTRKISNHYFYEFSAFMEALKSAIDFLAAACEPHIKGIDFDSITTLIKLVRKGVSNPIIDAVKKNLKELQHIREYRHHVVHRIIFNINTINEKTIFDDKEFSARSPVMVPVDPPKYEPDTRRSRMIEGDNDISHSESILKINGKIVEYEKKFIIPEGYKPIEVFMNEKLNICESFFQNMIDALDSLNFSIIST